MIDESLALLVQAVTAVSGWFVSVLDATQSSSFYLTMMFVVLLFGYLLAPVLRSSGSDRAGHKNNKDDA